MARHDGDFTAAGETSLSAVDYLALAADRRLDPRERQQAIACYLSASDGWREALDRLGGAFAQERTTTRQG